MDGSNASDGSRTRRCKLESCKNPFRDETAATQRVSFFEDSPWIQEIGIFSMNIQLQLITKLFLSSFLFLEAREKKTFLKMGRCRKKEKLSILFNHEDGRKNWISRRWVFPWDFPTRGFSSQCYTSSWELNWFDGQIIGA